MNSQEFACFQVSSSSEGQVRHSIRSHSIDVLPAGEVLIRVEWSSLNYKDALAADGHPGVAGKLPHVPGIDAMGSVQESTDPRYQPGDKVLVTGYELGAPAWGGWSELVRVPADWVVPLPSTLSGREAMVLGTAGFTAGQCAGEIQARLQTEDGPLVVTGATGGVGCWSVLLLSKLGYEVYAVTGKKELSQRLEALGAAKVHPRDLLQDNPKRPMLSANWAGGVDTVGGDMLTALLKSTKIGGCVAACGVVGGDRLNLTVYPFILRGITLAGITSAFCPRETREDIWRQLAGDWHWALPEDWVEEITLADLPDAIARIKAGKIAGRVLVKVAD